MIDVKHLSIPGILDDITFSVAPGERVLASCESVDGVVLAGTRDALYLGSTRIPWEQVEAADWDRDTDAFSVSLVGSWGQEKVSHSYDLKVPGRLLELVREELPRATIVSVGFAAAPVVNSEPSAMNRFGTSWVWPNALVTPSSGRSLIRAVPMLCVDG